MLIYFKHRWFNPGYWKSTLIFFITMCKSKDSSVKLGGGGIGIKIFSEKYRIRSQKSPYKTLGPYLVSQLSWGMRRPPIYWYEKIIYIKFCIKDTIRYLPSPSFNRDLTTGWGTSSKFKKKRFLFKKLKHFHEQENGMEQKIILVKFP